MLTPTPQFGAFSGNWIDLSTVTNAWRRSQCPPAPLSPTSVSVYNNRCKVLKRLLSCAILEKSVIGLQNAELHFHSNGFAYAALCLLQCPGKCESVCVDEIYNIRLTKYCGAIAWCLYLLGLPNSLIPLHSKTALLWWVTIAGNNTTYLRLHVKCPIFWCDFKPNLKFLERFS